MKNFLNIVVCALRVYKKNVETIFATFDLTNINENQTFYISVNNKTSDEKIETIKGITGFSELRIDVSRNVYRPNEYAYADITITNKGDTDIFLPTLHLSTMQYIPISLTTSVIEFVRPRSNSAISLSETVTSNISINNQYQKEYAVFEDPTLQDSLYIEQRPSFKFIKINNYDYPPYSSDYIIPLNLNGLGAIIQPRSKVSLRLKAQPYDSLYEGSGRFSIIEYSFLSFIKRNLNLYKPESYSDFVWNSISTKFKSKVENNINDILYETINVLSENGDEFYRVEDLVIYHINRLDGGFLNENLIDSFEFEMLENEFYYIRSYSTKFSIRNKKSQLGIGWVDSLNLNVQKINNNNYEYFRLEYIGIEYTINFRSSNASYFSESIQIKYDESTKIAKITNKDINLIFDYDFNSKCIQKIKILNGKNELNVDCKNGKILKIYNSRVSFEFIYTSTNLYRSITKKSLNEPMDTYSFTYDKFDRLIRFTNSLSSLTYSYDENNNLIEAKHENLLMKYEYEENLLSHITKFINNKKVEDYLYKYYDYGPIEVTDLINERVIRYLFGLNGRLLSQETNEINRVNFVYSRDSLKKSIFINGELVKQDFFVYNTNTLSQIENDAVFTKRIVYQNQTHELIEYTDRLNNKLSKLKFNLGNKEYEELKLLNGLNETKVYDYEQNEVKVSTRMRDELTVKYDENFQRIFYSHATGDSSCSFEYNDKRLMTQAKGEDSFASVSNLYDSLGRLTKNIFKNNYEIEYIYDENSNVIEVKTNNNLFNLKYSRESNQNINEIKLNNEIIATITYTDAAYELNFPKISRYFKYSFFKNSGLLSKYVIGDSNNEANTVTYEYEYNHKYLKSSMKLVTVNGESFKIFYDYDNSNRLVNLISKKLNTTISIIYDSNGNRRKMIRQIDQNNESYDYTVNRLNQYENDGKNNYEYDLNGNLIKLRSFDNNKENVYKYYPDGKLSQFITTDDNCVLKYDCLERLSQISCTKSGVSLYNYHLLSQKPFSYVLQNGTHLYFIYLPGLEKPLGYLINSTVYYFEYNGELNVQQILSLPVKKPPITMPNPDPFMPLSNSLGFDYDTFGPIISNILNISNLILNPINKPYSSFHRATFGQSIFNIDSIINQNLLNNAYSPIEKFKLNGFTTKHYESKSSRFSLTNEIDSINLLPFSKIFSKPPSNNMRSLNLLSSLSSAKSSVCDKYNSFISGGSINKKFKSAESHMNNDTKGFIVDELCSAIGTFWSSYVIGNESLADSFREVIKGSTLNTAVNLACCTSFSCFYDTTTDYVSNGVENLLKDKALSYLTKYVPFGKCLNEAIKAGTPFLNFFKWAKPQDPNEIIGPDSFGPNNYVSKNQKFSFIINYENLANVTAPAQVVKIQSILNDNFNYATLAFTRYGFNDIEKKIDISSKPYVSDIIDFEEYVVRILATVNPITREMIWTFKTVDKSTGISNGK